MFSKKRILMISTCLLITSLCLLTGCNNSSDEVPASTATPLSTQVVEATAEPTATPEVETKALTISVLNLSEVDAGMFAVIDPVTGEQMNIDGMTSGETISLECNWPVDTAEFQWALYDLQGELCIEASTDLTAAKDKISLVLVGTETIENVEVMYE